MKTSALARFTAGLLLTVLVSLSPAQAKEDAARCHCWYAGYDGFEGGGYTDPSKRRASCKTTGPDSSVNECDRDEKRKELWTDGCIAHALNEPRKCPYKSAEAD